MNTINLKNKPQWKVHQHDPYNHIGWQVIADDRRTKLITRVDYNYIGITPDPENKRKKDWIKEIQDD